VSPFLPEVCIRTREQVSLRLDTELSELEEALVKAHLTRCVACRSFALELETLTATLRSAPLAEPSMCVQLPRRPPARRRLRIGLAHASTAAVGAVVAAVAIVGYAGLHSPQTQISALDIRSAHERMLAKEPLLEALEGASAQPTPPTPRAVQAAEGTTLDHSPPVTPSLGGAKVAALDASDIPGRNG
jgi:predicted anti-sigma-YlaC factor YlaD